MLRSALALCPLDDPANQVFVPLDSTLPYRPNDGSPHERLAPHPNSDSPPALIHPSTSSVAKLATFLAPAFFPAADEDEYDFVDEDDDGGYEADAEDDFSTRLWRTVRAVRAGICGGDEGDDDEQDPAPRPSPGPGSFVTREMRIALLSRIGMTPEF